MSKKRTEQSRRSVPALLRFFINSSFGMQLLGCSLVFLGCSAFLIYHGFHQQYQQVMEIFQIVDPNTQQELIINDIFIRNILLLACTALVYVGSVGFLFYRARQSYEGPVLSIENFVMDMTRGHYHKQIETRKGDAMQELVMALNQMAVALEQRHGGRKEMSEPSPTAENNYGKVGDV